MTDITDWPTIHSGQPKSGPWLLIASQHEASHDDPSVWGEKTFEPREDDQQDKEIEASIHSGQLKSGPWLLEASRHQAADDGWQQADWRNASDYGAFHSTSRPATSSDIPHPSKVKLSPAAAARAATTEDTENDPYGVLNGSGKNFEGLVNNIVSHHNQASPDTHYEGRVWYPAAHDYVKDLSDKSINDPNRTAAVFASLSPQNDWDNNIEHGTHFMLHYNGDPGFGMPRILGSNVDKAKQIYHSPDENYGAILNGPKTRSFHHNIVDNTPLREPRPGEADDAGYFQHATNPHSGEQDWRLNPDQDVTADTHHARASSTPHGGDLSDAKYQVPADFSYNAASGGKKLEPGYDLYNRATQEATRRVNAAQPDPARHLTPKQMQAIVWTKFKGDVDQAGKGRDFNPPGVPPKGLQKWKEKGKPESEWAAKNPSVSEHPTIPRYQREHDPDYWTDPYRRPDPNIRSAPGYHRDFPVPAQKASAVANNGSLWGKVLGSYIARNPQHKDQQAPPVGSKPKLKPRRPQAPQVEHNPRRASWYLPERTARSWYITADDITPGSDKEKEIENPSGMAGGDISGGSSPATITPSTGEFGNWSTDPHASPMPSAAPSGGGGGSGGAPVSGGGGGGGGTPVSYDVGSGVKQWEPQVEEGLRRNGLPTTPDYVQRIEHQMQTESSGNPNAINKTDSNAIAGHPSQGLMQTIPGTFNQYHLPGDSANILDPQANIDSAIGYGKSRYGPTLMDSHGQGIGSGHGY